MGRALSLDLRRVWKFIDGSAHFRISVSRIAASQAERGTLLPALAPYSSSRMRHHLASAAALRASTRCARIGVDLAG
jgi:hypothetical protein